MSGEDGMTYPRTLTLDKDDAMELRWDDRLDGYEVIQRGEKGHRRWAANAYVVFKREGVEGFWRWHFDTPLTEIQDYPDLYEHSLVAVEVFPHEETITVYRSEAERRD